MPSKQTKQTFAFGAATYGEALVKSHEYAQGKFAPYDVRKEADQCFAIYQSGDTNRYFASGCERKVADGYLRRW